MEKINLLQKANAVKGLYVYDKIARFNGNNISVVQVENRTLDMHIHEHSDEIFFVIEGSFELETEDGLTRVNAGEFVVVPKGTMHRPVVKELTKFMMIEADGTLNKKNSGSLYED